MRSFSCRAHKNSRTFSLAAEEREFDVEGAEGVEGERDGEELEEEEPEVEGFCSGLSRTMLTRLHVGRGALPAPSLPCCWKGEVLK